MRTGTGFTFGWMPREPDVDPAHRRRRQAPLELLSKAGVRMDDGSLNKLGVQE